MQLHARRYSTLCGWEFKSGLGARVNRSGRYQSTFVPQERRLQKNVASLVNETRLRKNMPGDLATIAVYLLIRRPRACTQ